MKKEKKEKEVRSRKYYLPKSYTPLICKYLEINGMKKCTHKMNSDVRKNKHLDGREKHGLFYKRCECKYCPLFDKKQYQKLFKK